MIFSTREQLNAVTNAIESLVMHIEAVREQLAKFRAERERLLSLLLVDRGQSVPGALERAVIDGEPAVPAHERRAIRYDGVEVALTGCCQTCGRGDCESLVNGKECPLAKLSRLEAQ